MAQIYGQMRQVLIDIQASAVPVEHAPNGEGVAETPQVRTNGTGGSVDAQATDDSQEGAAHRAVGKRGSCLRDEEPLRKIADPQPLTSRRIAAQCFGSTGVDRDQSRLVELGFTDDKPRWLGIHLDIGTAQADCFPWAETAACE